jgi:O-antigen ligase
MADGSLTISQDQTRGTEQVHRATSAPAELPLPNLLVLAALAAALVAQGGYYATGQRLVAALLFAAAILSRGPWRPATVARRTIAPICAALAAWSVVSAVLAGDWTAATSTVLLLTGAVVVILTCARLDVPQRDQLAAAVIGLGAAVALTGWAGVAWHGAPWALKDQGLWRAATTLTYANAAAGFLAAVSLLSLARSAAERPTVVGAGSTFFLLTGLGATLSRGGIVAFLAGAVVLVRLLGIGRVVRHAAAPAIGALVALAGLWPSIPDSAPARPLLASGALVAGLLVAVGAARLGRRPVAALVAVSALAVVVIGAGPAQEASEKITSARFALASPDRVGEMREALRLAASRPLSGVGPGQADLTWERADGAVLVARYAHNEYLQVLAELGVMGLGLLLLLLALIARTVVHCPLRDRMRPVWAGVAAGLVALGVHGLFDFGWHLPAIALTGAVLVGIVTTSEREDQA